MAYSDPSQYYQNFYGPIDTFLASGLPFSIDEAGIAEAGSLDTIHPCGYFQRSGETLAESRFDQAAFLYYLGVLRYGFYNSTNPDYEESGDGALYAALKSVVGQQVNLFLKCDADRFVAVLRFVADYGRNNDSSFFSREKDAGKYNEYLNSLSETAEDLDRQREKYKIDWAEERKSLLSPATPR